MHAHTTYGRALKRRKGARLAALPHGEIMNDDIDNNRPDEQQPSDVPQGGTADNPAAGNTADLQPPAELTADGLKYSGAKDAAKGGVLGLFIGLAIIIPGVSGSAVAIVMKLYEKLLYAISNIFKSFKKCLIFLLPIGIGAVLGFVLGFFAVKALLEIAMFAVVALFAGLMVGALPAIKDEVAGEKIKPARMILFVLGLLIPVAITLAAVFAESDATKDLGNVEAYEYVLFVLIGFAVALTQLVPGLSATALLMTTGHYVPLVDSVSLTYWQNNPAIFAVYACLAAGFVAGLLCFAKLISLLLKKFRAETFFCVAGLAIGSVFTMFFNPEMYEEYARWAEGARFGPDIAMGSVLFIAGIVCAYMFVRMQRKAALPLQSKK